MNKYFEYKTLREKIIKFCYRKKHELPYLSCWVSFVVDSLDCMNYILLSDSSGSLHSSNKDSDWSWRKFETMRIADKRNIIFELSNRKCFFIYKYFLTFNILVYYFCNHHGWAKIVKSGHITLASSLRMHLVRADRLMYVTWSGYLPLDIRQGLCDLRFMKSCW